MVKPEKSDHLHLFYHFAVPLSIVQIYWKYTSKVYLKYTASILKAYFKYTSSILQPVELQKKYTSSLYYFDKRSTFEAHFVKLNQYF